MKTGRLAAILGLGLVSAWLLHPFHTANGTPIESGQYFTDNLSTNANFVDPYYFFAVPDDTILIRMANEDSRIPHVPDIRVLDPSGNPMAHETAKFTKQDVSVTATEFGWHTLNAELPLSLYTYSNTLSYSVSILRMPDAPLSYADLDVGPMLSGESARGTIGVGADLDAGTFAVSDPVVVQIRMGQGAPIMVPQLQLYDPLGNLIISAYPPEYRAEITSPLLTTPGIYTIVCNDHFNARGPYALSMVRIPGVLEGEDTDIGLIINGETRYGKIDHPGDLDLAWFQALAEDVITIRMRAEDAALNPVMELWGPDAQLIQTVTDPMQQEVAITNLMLAQSGQYTLICKDAEDRFNVIYSLALDFISGPSTESLPSVPAALSASKGTYSNYVQVSWSTADGALGYDLWRSHGTNAPARIVTNHTATVYQDYGVITNITYYYRVKSRNTYGVSTNFSNTDSGWAGIATIPASDRRRAVLVGIDNYSSAYPGGQPSPLNSCVNDAHGIRDIMLLGDPSNKWSEADIQLFADRQATKATLRGALQQLAGMSGAGDLVLYTHSSHGGQTNPHVNPYDTFICAYDNNYYDYELAQDLANFRVDTRVILIIDTCHSGGMFRTADGRPYWPFAERVMANYRRIKGARMRALGQTVPRDLGANIAFMTASNYDELSWEIGQYAVYTGYLLEACALPEQDTNLDGLYSFLELHTYAAAKTTQRIPEQHPQTHNPALLEATIARGVGIADPATRGIIYNDYDGNRISDIALYHEASGQWLIGSLARQEWLVNGLVFGGPGYRPITGDYDGDGYADLALYNEAAGTWTIGSLKRWRILCQDLPFGGPGLRPVAGDYTGNRSFDGGLYAHDSGLWYVVNAQGVEIVWGQTWTGQGYSAVPGDFDGDGRADHAMYNDRTGHWFIRSSTGSNIVWGLHFGGAEYRPVAGDYSGDGRSDLAVYNPATGAWYIWSLATSGYIVENIVWGGAGYIPVPGDYNGDGRYDLVVYNEATGHWALRTVSGGQRLDLMLGGPGYVPVLPTLW